MGDPALELVDVVDEHGAVVDTVTRQEMRAGRLRHRTVFVAVLDGDGRLLAHRRADWKDVWPGAWDLAFGGVVGAGESWEAAAERELQEEAGVVGELIDLGEDVYADDAVREVARVYRTDHRGPFTFRDGEVVDVRWVRLDELAGFLADHVVCPDSQALVVPRLGPR